jgi:hypothetical protein
MDNVQILNNRAKSNSNCGWSTALPSLSAAMLSDKKAALDELNEIVAPIKKTLRNVAETIFGDFSKYEFEDRHEIITPADFQNMQKVTGIPGKYFSLPLFNNEGHVSLLRGKAIFLQAVENCAGDPPYTKEFRNTEFYNHMLILDTRGYICARQRDFTCDRIKEAEKRLGFDLSDKQKIDFIKLMLELRVSMIKPLRNNFMRLVRKTFSVQSEEMSEATDSVVLSHYVKSGASCAGFR